MTLSEFGFSFCCGESCFVSDKHSTMHFCLTGSRRSGGGAVDCVAGELRNLHILCGGAGVLALHACFGPGFGGDFVDLAGGHL